jgi:hypothetical protein
LYVPELLLITLLFWIGLPEELFPGFGGLADSNVLIGVEAGRGEGANI